MPLGETSGVWITRVARVHQGGGFRPAAPGHPQSSLRVQLLNISERGVDSNDVGSKIVAVHTLVLIWTARQQLVISAVAVVEVSEADVIDGLREHVLSGPA